MLKEHPKGLLIASLSNMGERFGFYTMMAVLVFFLQARYGMNAQEAGDVYGNFYFGIYAMALVGGLLADRFTGLGRTILTGIITMFAGYIILTVPGMSEKVTYIGLFVIAAGNGLFKGNLQALVGNLYEDKKYAHLRDSGFSIFYMCINIGAFFAPTAAETMLNRIMTKSGFLYQGQLPAFCHAYLNGDKGLDVQSFTSLAEKASLQTGALSDLNDFATRYLDAVSASYNYAFGIAGVAMLISMSVFLLYKKHLKPGDYNTKVALSRNQQVEEITPRQEKERMSALLMVFLVVIFFWMSFHQNGLTLNFFARDYTVTSVSRFTNLFFNIYSFLALIGGVVGLYFVFVKQALLKNRLIALAFSLSGFFIAGYFYWGFGDQNPISPVKFQQFNAIFIVLLTPVVVSFFGWLNRKGKEPSTPRKIGFGMVIAAIAFLIMVFSSFGLTPPKDLVAEGSGLVSPYWLIGTYLTLTFAELCLSPMGISFVSKVAPPKYKGLMQGGWLCATAVGNKLLSVGSYFWEKLELWQLWLIFVICCLISATIIFSLMKFLERVTK